MATSVRGAGIEGSNNHIRQVRKELPGIIREKVETGHTNWNTFLQAVQNIDVEHIKDTLDTKKKEQAALDQHFRMLETVTGLPTAPLRQQLSAATISRQPSIPTATNNNTNPFTNPGSGQGNLRFPPPTTAPQYTSNRPMQPNFNTRPPPTAEQKAELRALINSMPHHPDTQAGRQAHQAQQAEWVRNHGFGTRVTEKMPYPLRPGTASVNSGECFTCGQVGHLGSQTGKTAKHWAFNHSTLTSNSGESYAPGSSRSPDVSQMYIFSPSTTMEPHCRTFREMGRGRRCRRQSGGPNNKW